MSLFNNLSVNVKSSIISPSAVILISDTFAVARYLFSPWNFLNLEFDLGIDLDTATNDVRERIARIVDDIPDQAEPPQIFKASAAINASLISSDFLKANCLAS